mmetsp:Transcript_13428/g.28138  ORF Transcript_13428/g.28138 Transcript_13428/m.28138 type:complete len:270 (-) Transcript_13428:674-1483(-)
MPLGRFIPKIPLTQVSAVKLSDAMDINRLASKNLFRAASIRASIKSLAVSTCPCIRSSAFDNVRALFRFDSNTNSGSSDSISSISELTGCTKFSGLVTSRETFISAMSSSSFSMRLMDWTNPLTRACITRTEILRLRITARESSGRSCFCLLLLLVLPMIRFWTYLSPFSCNSSVSVASISNTVERHALTHNNSKVRSFCWSISILIMSDQSSSEEVVISSRWSPSPSMLLSLFSSSVFVFVIVFVSSSVPPPPSSSSKNPVSTSLSLL